MTLDLAADATEIVCKAGLNPSFINSILCLTSGETAANRGVTPMNSPSIATTAPSGIVLIFSSPSALASTICPRLAGRRAFISQVFVHVL